MAADFHVDSNQPNFIPIFSLASVPGDRRALKANLSEKGMLMRSSVLKALDEMTRQAFAGIAPEEMEIVKKTLRNVMENAR